MRNPIRRISKGLRIMLAYRVRWVVFIALGWTLLDMLLWMGREALPGPGRTAREEQYANEHSGSGLLLHSAIVLGMSIFMGWLLVFRFRNMFKNVSRIKNVLYKTLILIACSFLLNFFNVFATFLVIENRGFTDSLTEYWTRTSEKFWLLNGVPLWLMIFLATQLLIEVNEKYSPGVYADILTGRYIEPQEESRIVMFLDLKDSTPIAETLGHKLYFSFIRDFIFQVSVALIDNNARIYQYVGDEIVTSWPLSRENATACVKALLQARRQLQQESEVFRRKYGIVPDFRAGIHAGTVMVGEIGVIKKDLAMSGDTMNTAARIRSSCSDLGHRYMASGDFMELTDLKDWQSNSFGSIDLKGKSSAVMLYSLKI